MKAGILSVVMCIECRGHGEMTRLWHTSWTRAVAGIKQGQRLLSCICLACIVISPMYSTKRRALLRADEQRVDSVFPGRGLLEL